MKKGNFIFSQSAQIPKSHSGDKEKTDPNHGGVGVTKLVHVDYGT
jgi:hypothetical protein